MDKLKVKTLLCELVNELSGGRVCLGAKECTKKDECKKGCCKKK